MQDLNWAEKFFGWIVALLAGAWLTVVGLLKFIYSSDKTASDIKINDLKITVEAIKNQLASLENSLLMRLNHQDKILEDQERGILGVHSRLDGLGAGGIRRSRSPPRLTRQHRRYTKKTEEDPDPSDEF